MLYNMYHKLRDRKRTLDTFKDSFTLDINRDYIFASKFALQLQEIARIIRN